MPSLVTPSNDRLRTAAEGTARWIAAAAAFVLMRSQQRLRQRATRRVLERLDDRTLRDIGIDREEISSISVRCSVRRFPDIDIL